MLLCLQPLSARRREHDDLAFITTLAEAEDVHTAVMCSDFDVAIIRSAPLIDDFDDVDPTLSPKKTSGRRSEIRMRLNLNAHEFIRWDSRIVHPQGPCDLASPAGTAAPKPPTPISRDNFSSSATRFSVDGWVENKLSIPRPDSGLMIKRGAVVG